MVYVFRSAKLVIMFSMILHHVLNAMKPVLNVLEEVLMSVLLVLMVISKKMARMDVIHVITSVQHVSEIHIRNASIATPDSFYNKEVIVSQHVLKESLITLRHGHVMIVSLGVMFVKTQMFVNNVMITIK